MGVGSPISFLGHPNDLVHKLQNIGMGLAYKFLFATRWPKHSHMSHLNKRDPDLFPVGGTDVSAANACAIFIGIKGRDKTLYLGPAELYIFNERANGGVLFEIQNEAIFLPTP